MSAVFEVHLMCKKSISLFKLMSILKKNDISYSIESKECMDNWEYDNQQTLNNQSIDQIDSLIQNQEKIILIEGWFNSMYRFGISFFRDEGDQYGIDFWINTKGLEQLDSNYITETNIKIYEKIKMQITAYMDREQLVLCCMGSEILIPELSHIEDIVANSKNVCMWIFPNDMYDIALNDYKKEMFDDFFVYSLF